MDLFVINRHEGDEPKSVDQTDTESKLDGVFKRIERNKRLRKKQKEKSQKTKEAIQRTLESRQIKREIKAKIVPVPENINDEFIDKNIISEDVKQENEVKAQKRRKVDVNVEGFTILGAESNEKKVKVKRVLPKWLSNPTIISVNLQNLKTKVSEIKLLDKSLRSLLKKNNISHFFPVQAEVIPWLLQSNKQADVIFPRDICVSAPTGSGKTLAFVLPVIQSLKKPQIKRIRALVILPTQELAKQVYKCFKIYSEGTDIDVCLVTGQNSFEMEQKQLISQNEAFGYVSKVDILVCTAGRLVDHLKLTKGFSLQHLEFLIIDEADRVLDNVQNDWLYHLESHISLLEDEDIHSIKVLNVFALQKQRPPQKLLFSATLSQDPEKLQKLSLFQPKLFTSIIHKESNENPDNISTFIGKYTTPTELTENYIETSLDLKPLVLYKFIKSKKLTKTLIFTHSVESTHRLTILLKAMFENELTVQEISSQLQSKERNELIKQFSEGFVDLLICTDALARGIDLPSVQCVISYSVPKYLKTYIHRVGRTARAGEKGLAVTLVQSPQLSKFKSLIQQAEKNIEEIKVPEEDLEPLAEKYKQSLAQLKETIGKEVKADLEKVMSTKRRKKIKRKRKNSLNSVISAGSSLQ